MSELATVALAVTLAFAFGYAFTLRGLFKAGLGLSAALRAALAADTLSITVMEIVDNAIMLSVPGAMEAGVTSWLFWGALAVALAVAFVVTVPVNRWLIARGRGHAVLHAVHAGQAGPDGHAPAPTPSSSPHGTGQTAPAEELR